MANTPFVVVFSADTDQAKRDDANPASVFERIVEERPDRYIFGGDGPYSHEGKTWTKLIDKYELTPIIKIAQGNHDWEESEKKQTRVDIEDWMPSLKETPEVNPNQKNWWKSKWIHTWQDKNAFFIVMNSSDLDIKFKRNHYNWVLNQIEVANKLRSEGKVDWIFGIMHKPWYTLKTRISPEIEIRRIYQPLFDELGVDFMLYGHNHNFQVWLPMVSDATQKFTKNQDGSYDFSAPHGQFHIVNGAGGHTISEFEEDWKDNNNVIYANDSEFCYTVFKIEGKVCDVITKNVNKKQEILFSMRVIK
jgi:hypothetical protein